MKLQWLKQQKPVTHADKALVYIEKVLAIVQERAASIPEDDPCLPLEDNGEYKAIFFSMLKQIQYVKNVLIRPSTDRSKLHDISLGNFAAKEFAEVDPELSEALGGVNYIAYQVGHGLKIDPQELEESLRELSSFTTKP